jgi:hypothetical protein
MDYPMILITFFVFFVFYCIKVMIQRGHDLHAFSFFILLIYTIFVQVGYVYFPQMSISFGTYYGPEIFYKYWIFVFMSFLFSFLIYKKTTSTNFSKNLFHIKKANRVFGKKSFFIFSFLLFFVLDIYFIQNKELFGWGDGNPMGTQLFGLGFAVFTICMFFVYLIYRNKEEKTVNKRLALILFILFFLFFLNVCFAAGSRSNILYFLFAIFFYEFSPFRYLLKFQKKKIILVLIFVPFLINSLMIISSLRDKDVEINFSTFINYTNTNSENKDLSDAIIAQDYFAPSQLLFISMNYDIIDPIETFKSNFYNTFVFFEYPYLTQIITNKIGKDFTRGEGWGYYLFVEGYNAVGWFGFIYNAILWNLGMALWITLARSNSVYHNKAMLSLLVLFIGNQIRSGQTCNFIHTYWMLLLPSMFLLLMSTNTKVVFINRQ